MKKRGKITISLVIFIALVLSIFVLQTKIIVSADNNLSINQSNDKNLEFKIMPAQVGRAGFSGSAKFLEQPKKSEEVLLKNISAEVEVKQIEEIQLNVSEVNETVKYDSEILEAFNNYTEIPVIVRLKDNSNITVTGTKEERRVLSKQKDEWFKPVVNDVLATLPENEFEGERLNNRIIGIITKNGFETLLNDSRVKSISWVKYGAQASLHESVPLIKVRNDVWNLGYTGSGIKVCVIDTGVNATHPDLSGKIVDNHCYCRTPGDGYSYCCPPDHSRESDDATDDEGHGTHITGIVASQDSTYKGVAYDADIYVVKVLNSSGGGKAPWVWADLAEAIDWCRINKSANVISISIGDEKEYGPSGQHGSCPDHIDEEINNAYNNGTLVIISSGNKGYTNGISYPACSPNAISVGATHKSDTIWSDTNRGSNLDLLAPGVSIMSLRWNPQETSGGCVAYGSDFMVCSGTSQATPHVSGAAALLLDAKSTLTPSQIETALEDNGVSVSGYPRIDVKAALDSVCDKDGDGYLDEACAGGTDCDDNDGSVHPGATEACDGIDNDCDDTVDEGCGEVQECEQSGYEWCIEYEDENCDVSIAMNVYDNVNDIQWGDVNDGWDPYVIDEYTIGWKDREAEEMYYDIDDPNNACTDDEGYCQGGCDGEQIADTGTRVTVTAPGTAHFEEVLGYDEDGDYCCWVWYYAFNPNYGGNNPIYVLKCFDDNDCSSGYYCDKSGSWSSWDCVAKKSNGESCTSDSDCNSNNCVTAINSGSKYCAAATKECSRSGYDPGYDTGNEYGAYICKGDDLGGQECNSGNACHEYGGKYCNGVNDWVTDNGGDSEGQDANCNVCVVCSSGTGDTPSCSSNVAINTADAGECTGSTGCESSDCLCDGSGNCDSDEEKP